MAFEWASCTLGQIDVAYDAVHGELLHDWIARSHRGPSHARQGRAKDGRISRAQRADRVRNGHHHQAARHRKAPLSHLTEYVIALADLLEAEGKILRCTVMRTGVGLAILGVAGLLVFVGTDNSTMNAYTNTGFTPQVTPGP